jgi:hypothetical protein
MVKKFSAFPSEPELKPLGKTPPQGRSIAMISCPLPQCTPEADAFTQAADKLGWKSKVIISDFAPDAYVAAWQSALSLKPDGLVYIA